MSRIGTLGTVVFETSDALVRNFQELEDRRHSRYATHDVLKLEQKLQFLGLSLAEISLQMNFHHRFCEPEEELSALRKLLSGYIRSILMIGNTYFGIFVVEEVRSVWRQVTNEGKLLTASANVRLKEYK